LQGLFALEALQVARAGAPMMRPAVGTVAGVVASRAYKPECAVVGELWSTNFCASTYLLC